MAIFAGKVWGSIGVFIGFVTMAVFSFAVQSVVTLIQVGAGVFLISWLFGWPFEI